MDPPNPNPNSSALVDPQAYARKRQMIQQARMYIDQVEAQNEVAFQAYADTEHELQRRIREGIEAQMLVAQLRTGTHPQQAFIAQQPQATAWQTPPVPLPNVQENFIPTSARIEEVPSGRSSRSGSHPTFQRNDNGSYYQGHHSPQSEVPQSTNVSYGYTNYAGVPAQTTTFIHHNFHSGHSSGQRDSYPPPPPIIHTPAAPVRPPPPPLVYQPPTQKEPPRPVASASSPTFPYPVPVQTRVPQPSAEYNQPPARYDYVKELIDFLKRHPPDVQRKVLAQIVEYVGGKPTPSPQIRTWGDRLKQVGGSDPKELLNVVIAKLSEHLKAQKATRPQTSQALPQVQTEPPPQPQLRPQPLPAAPPQFSTTGSDKPPGPMATSFAERSADGTPPFSRAEEQALNNLIVTYNGELTKAAVDRRGVSDIITAAYISARLKQPPNSADPWVQKTLDIFEQSFPVDRVPLVLEFLLKRLRLPIPNVPVPTEPRTMNHSSSSLAGALVDATSNVSPLTGPSQPSVVAQPLVDDEVVEIDPPNPPQKAQISQWRIPQPATTSRTQEPAGVSHLSAQPSPSIIPTSNAYPASADHNTFAISDNAPRQGYRPTEYGKPAVAPRYNPPGAVPGPVHGEAPRTQPSGWASYGQSIPSVFTLPTPAPNLPTSTSTLLTSTPILRKVPPPKVRLPRQADRFRLAKDILKQLGKPTGAVPAVPTRREYKERKKAAAQKDGASAQPSTEPVVEPQLVLNHDDVPLLPEVVPTPDQVMLPTSSSNPPQDPVDEPPSLGYPDQHIESAPHETNVIDVDMNIQPSGGPSVPQLPDSPGQGPPKDSVPSPVARESAQDEGGSATNNPPPSEPRSPGWNGPPPDAEIIEISDDEEQPVVGTVTDPVVPMEVDKEVRAGVVEVEQDRTEEPLDHRSSQEPVVSKGKQITEKKWQKFQPYVELPPLPDYMRRDKGKGRAAVEEENGEDPELRAIVELAFSRLRPTRCLWLGCRATLNSVDNLIKHLKIHADDVERTSGSLDCQWKKCTKSFRTRVKLDRHCMHHAQKVLHCPYEDCEDEFRDAGELLDHTKDMHENSDLLPSTNPVPFSGRVPDPLPEQVPSWTIFPASAAPVPISAERHGQVGRWVARNICGTAKRADTSKRLRSLRRFDGGKQKSTVSEMEDAMNEERFGFLSSTDDGNTILADIPSEAVSLSCRYGLFTLSGGDAHHDAPRESRKERPRIKGVDREGGLIRASGPVEEEAISPVLEPGLSDDELLLKPSGQ